MNNKFIIILTLIIGVALCTVTLIAYNISVTEPTVLPGTPEPIITIDKNNYIASQEDIK